VISSREIVFVSGLHRSGTSIFHRQFREHPDVSGFTGTGVPEDEGQHLQTVFEPAREFGGAGCFSFDPAARLVEDDALKLGELGRNQLVREWSRFWDSSKRVLVEKSPPTVIRSRFFQKLFPQSHFVFLVRHPIAVTYATWCKPRQKLSLPQIMFHWAYAHSLLLQDLAFLGSAMVIRYEDFVNDPIGTHYSVQRQLRLAPFAPEEAAANYNEKYFERWERDILNKEALNCSLGDGGGVASRFGYKLSAPYVEGRAATPIAG